MTDRSARLAVRNPILGLAAAKLLRELPPEARSALREVLAEIAKEARARAEASWNTRKAPMAAYWQAVNVYAKHIKHAVNR
jgi:hypothetical protein